MPLALFIPGRPIQQGSMIARIVKGRAVVHSHASAELKAWRKTIATAIQAHGHPQIGPYVEVRGTYYMPKPASTKFPEYPAGPPDLDKLTRATFDAITQSGLIEDDARIVRMVIEEEWAAASGEPGLALWIGHR
jgi:Holliday junction resolvase RusA-like endonuclease